MTLTAICALNDGAIMAGKKDLSLEERLSELEQLVAALENGASDNITVVLARCEGGDCA